MSIIKARDLAVGYDRGPIVSSVSLELAHGESLLLLGHNGAGKTTLLRTLFGLQRPLAGEVELLGLPVQGSSIAALVCAGGRYLAQDARYFSELSIRQHRAVLQNLYGLRPEHLGDNEPLTARRVRQLSVGQRRIEALRLLGAGTPKLFLLDEPTAGIDVAHTAEVLQWLAAMRAKQVSFVVAEHDFDRLVPICDHAMVFRAGQVTYLGPAAALRDDAFLARHFL